MDRVAVFKSFIEKSPDDPFPRYGLAMEYRSRGELAEARAAFDEIMQRFPDYVPVYLMAGNNLEQLGEREAAIVVYERGVEAARAKGDGHARGELEAALAQARENE